jgi:GNAT superfamily N-acetyltransferase
MGFTLEPLDYTITAAEPGHLEKLPRIELAAVSRFRGYDVPATLFGDTTPIALATNGACVGFALVEPSGARLHLAELDVLPDHARRGVGRALVSQVERWGDAHGFAEVTLTTYRDVPWNGPLYRRLGYEFLPAEDLDAELVARLEAEAAQGLDSMPRAAMRKTLGRPTSASSRTPGGLP